MKIEFQKHFNVIHLLPTITLWTELEYYLYLEFWFWKWGMVIKVYDKQGK